MQVESRERDRPLYYAVTGLPVGERFTLYDESARATRVILTHNGSYSFTVEVSSVPRVRLRALRPVNG